MNSEDKEQLEKYLHRVSHDLQAPLSKIITISELLMEKLVDIDESDRDYLRRMHESAKKMRAQIDELTRSHAGV